MTSGMAKNDLLAFLTYLGEKGLMNPTSAAARKSSVSTLLGILPDEEVADVSTLNMEEVAKRFANLKGSEFKPESIRVYRSRVESAIKDFVAYKKNPLGFKPSTETRTRKPIVEKPRSNGEESPSSATALKPSTAPVFDVSENIFPIPLRTNLTVRVAGIPPDMTVSEAKRISNVIMALAVVADS